MKKTIVTLSSISFIVAGLLSSCESPSQKVVDAEKNKIEANEELAEANQEYIADVEQYKRETAEKINENNRIIEEFKARKDIEKKEARDEYLKEVARLEQKNSDMRKGMEEYKLEGKENWEKFKTEFNRDMEELGKSFKDLTVKNVKTN